jgi:hypothetical protein
VIGSEAQWNLVIFFLEFPDMFMGFMKPLKSATGCNKGCPCSTAQRLTGITPAAKDNSIGTRINQPAARQQFKNKRCVFSFWFLMQAGMHLSASCQLQGLVPAMNKKLQTTNQKHQAS